MITSCTVALLFLVASCRALEAFDCHSSAVNVTSYSLLDVEKCVQPSMDVLNETEVVVQVIQKNKFVNVEVSQCYLFIEQYITHCGMHSHSSLAFQGREDIFYEFSKVECDSLIQMNRFVYPYRPDYINTYSPNEYHLGTINVVGTVKSDSSCTGGTYTYKGSNLEDVIVQHKFKLYYNSLTAKYDVNNEELLIKGITCPYNKLKCRDFHLGFLFWNRRPNINCDLNIFTSVYRGPARQVTLTDSKSKIVYNILTVKQNMFVFSLRLIGKLITCYESYVTTDHSDLFVFIEGDPHNFRSTRRNETATENVSLISYINTKFYYVQHHFAEQLQTMYASILFQQCELKHLTFMNLLSLAYTSPEQFAYSLMKKPGYSAIVSGEIAHVIHCPSVHVSFRPDLKCYQEIPVTYKNQSAFITPRNRIITYHATEIVCNPLYGTAYNLSNVWTSTMNNGHRINSPIKLNPNLNRTWDFEYEHNLASAGLYSNEELESLTRRMLFANERAAVTNTLANTLTDADTNRQGLNFHRLLDEESIKKSISSHFDRFMAKLTTFGLYCSTAIGVVTIVKWSINAIEILLNAFHLYKVFGWSMKLFAAFFHSVTTYFLLFFQEKRAYDQAPYNDATAPPAKNNETLPTYPSLPV